ncbi:MAG TPA: hypothetical protein VMH36_06920 [Alphaproteobacteria bacterium]|nr:hypothetical protein [Alphaproteobacteria bacterium]
MALLGKGVLAIWNGITDAAEVEFIKWHVREHIPERVGIPGFLRGRRYVALEGHPKYFNFYETESAGTLVSPAYRARLNAPTPWTQTVIKEFRDMSRTICDVVASVGRGEGAWIEAIRIGAVSELQAFARAITAAVVGAIAERDGIVGVHLLKGVEAPGNTPTVESKLRGRPDDRCDWILLVEAAELDLLRAAAPSGLLRQHAAGAAIERGIYRLQFGLTHAELELASARG